MVTGAEKPIERLRARLPDARPLGSGWYSARCPAHDDRHASFVFREMPDGKVSLRCFAGCRPEAILASLGLRWPDLYPPREGAGEDDGVGVATCGSVGGGAAHAHTPTPPHSPAATYDYLDGEGQLLYQVLRYQTGDPKNPKSFKQRRPDPQHPGEWLWNLQGVTRVLYRLLEVRAAKKAGVPIYLVEGEKDADRLTALGVCATTHAGGAAAPWEPQFSRELEGARVILLGDNDEPGRLRVARLSLALRGVARWVRVVELPGIQKHGDVCDWLDAGGSVGELERLAEAAPIGLFRQTDVGNVLRFIGRHGHDLRYLRYGPESGEWLVWNEQRWEPDLKGQVTCCALETVRSLYAEAAKEPADERRAILLKWAKASESQPRLAALCRLARDVPGINVSPEEFDTDPWLLNCPNGVVDLRTGELRPHRREELMRRMTAVPYLQDAPAPRWERFLGEVFQGRPGLPGYIERVLGYSLTGITQERQMWICWGGGRNGKSTLLETVGAVLGDYGCCVRADILAWRDREQARPEELVDLPGARFVWCSEMRDGQRLDEARVKGLTGGIDTLKARHLYKEEFTFRGQFKLFLATNPKPTVKGTDEAIWDRLKMIPFAVRFSDRMEEINAGALPLDKKLAEALRAEGPGILARLVRACLEWQRSGLGEPADVSDTTADYRAEMDVIGEFLKECCVLEPGAKMMGRQLYICYEQWCEGNGERPIACRKLTPQLRRYKLVDRHTRVGTEWQGVRLRGEEEGMTEEEEEDLEPGSWG